MRKIILLVLTISTISCSQKRFPYEIHGMIDSAESLLYTDTFTVRNDTIFVECSNGYIFKVTKPYEIKLSEDVK